MGLTLCNPLTFIVSNPQRCSQKSINDNLFFITKLFAIRGTYLTESEDLSLASEFVSSWSPTAATNPPPPPRYPFSGLCDTAAAASVLLLLLVNPLEIVGPPTPVFPVVVTTPDTTAFVTDDDETLVDIDDDDGDWIKGLAVAVK